MILTPWSPLPITGVFLGVQSLLLSWENGPEAVGTQVGWRGSGGGLNVLFSTSASCAFLPEPEPQAHL